MTPHAGFYQTSGGEVPHTQNHFFFKMDFVADYFERYSLQFFSYQQGHDLTHWHAHAGWLVPRSHWAQLLHAVPQHLIGCDEHDTDDERHGKGADEALPHTRLTVLF